MNEVAIVDTGGANLASLQYAFDRMECHIRVTHDPRVMSESSHVVLPGVGAAPVAMQRLREAGLIETLTSLTQPVLGICLGMQLLFERSEEGPTECLSLLPGTAQRLKSAPGRPIPHMGWNQLEGLRENPLLEGIAPRDYVYFIHSYAVPASQSTLASTEYGGWLSAIVRSGNFCGTQFHPERSGPTGRQLLKNFLRL